MILTIYIYYFLKFLKFNNLQQILTTQYIGSLVININEQIITCHFCLKTFEVDLGIDQTFYGHNTEIFDCEVCCNPNKVDTEIYEGEVSLLTVSDGNE